LLNSFFNFKVKNRLKKRLLKFYLVGLLGLGLSNGMLWVGMIYGFPPAFVKLFSIFVVAFVQFCLNKLITFRDKEIEEREKQ